MSATEADLDAAIRELGDVLRHWNGPDIAHAPTEASDLWRDWSGFMHGYFTTMLATVAGYKVLEIERAILRNTTPEQALGARKALDVFWRGAIARRGEVHRRGHLTLSDVQLAILADEAANRRVYEGVERAMEAAILGRIRTRRAALRGEDEDQQSVLDAAAADAAEIFGYGRAPRLSAAERNENFNRLLF